MPKRMVATFFVADGEEDAATAENIERHIGSDASVWDWEYFWLDVRNGAVGPTHDNTPNGGEWIARDARNDSRRS